MSNDDFDTPFSPEEEKVAQEFLTKGLERYAGIATPEMLANMAKIGIDGMRSHPVLRRLIRRLASRATPKVDLSGNKDKGGGPESGEGGAGDGGIDA